MSSRTQAFILLLFGGALTRLAFSDDLLRYVRPAARIWVLLAGIAILTVAIWSLVASLRAEGAYLDDADDAGEPGRAVGAHGHGLATKTAWFVLAPVIVILVVSPPALGSFSAARETSQVPQPARVDFPPLPTGDPVSVSMLNFATRVIWDDGRTVQNRRVRLTGFVLGTNPQGYVMTRLVITCCAADAQPVNVEVVDPGARFAVNSWTEVIGTYAGVSPQSKTLPLLKAEQIRPVKQPANPYDD